MSGLALKPMKIHTQKGKRRLWLEQQRYGLDGFLRKADLRVGGRLLQFCYKPEYTETHFSMYKKTPTKPKKCACGDL